MPLLPQVRSPAFADAPSMHTLLGYLEARLQAAAAAATTALAAAATALAPTTADVKRTIGPHTTASAALLAASPSASFLSSAALPFLHAFFHHVYRPPTATPALRAAAASLTAALAHLVGCLSTTTQQTRGLHALLPPDERSMLQQVRGSRVGLV